MISINKDEVFIKQLSVYINNNDVKTILDSFDNVDGENNINKRSGKIQIGRAKNTNAKKFILKKGSVKNYKSVILKFAKFKFDRVGKDADITDEIVQEYDEKILGNGQRKHQTIITNIRILNKYVITPVLDKEIKKPRVLGLSSYNNKPQLTHFEVVKALKYLWNTLKNRDHVYKLFLIYYTGLRSCEAEKLTFRDILDAVADSGNIIIKVRRGKNNIDRHVFMFRGAPTNFFLKYLIPYLEFKMLRILRENNKTRDNVSLYLDTPIFPKSSYQSALKEFSKALKKSNNISDEDITLKGAGLHSIRADFSTRALALLNKYSQNIFNSLKVVGQLLGHTSYKHVTRHYVNLGYNFNSNDNENMIEGREEVEEESTHPNNYNDVFADIPKGQVANNILSNNKRNHENLSYLCDIVDRNNIIPSKNESYEEFKTNILNSIVYV